MIVFLREKNIYFIFVYYYFHFSPDKNSLVLKWKHFKNTNLQKLCVKDYLHIRGKQHLMEPSWRIQFPIRGILFGSLSIYGRLYMSSAHQGPNSNTNNTNMRVSWISIKLKCRHNSPGALRGRAYFFRKELTKQNKTKASSKIWQVEKGKEIRDEQKQRHEGSYYDGSVPLPPGNVLSTDGCDP